MVPKRLFNDFATLNMHCYITGQIIVTLVINRETIKFLNSTHQLMLTINCSLEEPQKIIYLKYNHNELLLNTDYCILPVNSRDSDSRHVHSTRLKTINLHLMHNIQYKNLG